MHELELTGLLPAIDISSSNLLGSQESDILSFLGGVLRGILQCQVPGENG